MNSLQVAAKNLIDKYTKCEVIRFEKADKDPLTAAFLGEMKEAKHIPDLDSVYIEWEGLLEFGVIPVMVVDEKDLENGGSVMNVDADGKVTKF